MPHYFNGLVTVGSKRGALYPQPIALYAGVNKLFGTCSGGVERGAAEGTRELPRRELRRDDGYAGADCPGSEVYE